MINTIAMWIGLIMISLSVVAGLVIFIFYTIENIIKYTGYNTKVLQTIWSIFKNKNNGAK